MDESGTPRSKWRSLLEPWFPAPLANLVESYACVLDLDLLNTHDFRYIAQYERSDPELTLATVTVAENFVYQASEAKHADVVSDLLARLSKEQTVGSVTELLRHLIGELRLPASAFECLGRPVSQPYYAAIEDRELLPIAETAACDIKLSPLPSMAARLFPYFKVKRNDPLWVGRLALSTDSDSILPHWRRCAEVISQDSSFPANAREFLADSGSPESGKGLVLSSPDELWMTFFSLLHPIGSHPADVRLGALPLVAAFLGWQPELTAQSPVSALLAFQDFLARCDVYLLSADNFEQTLVPCGYVVVLPAKEDGTAGHSREAIVLYSAATEDF